MQFSLNLLVLHCVRGQHVPLHSPILGRVQHEETDIPIADNRDMQYSLCHAQLIIGDGRFISDSNLL